MKFRYAVATLLLTSLQSSVLPANADTTLNDGVYTEIQAQQGKVSYEKNCKACHPTEFYREQLLAWQQAPLIDFYDLISGTMPQNAPGTLPLQEYTDALAYILFQLGYPTGDNALNHEDGSMADVLIVKRKM